MKVSDDSADSAASASVAVWALCLRCNYPLRDLPADRCPECGRAFDPADRRTVNLGRPIGRLARWAMWPIGWPTCAGVGGAVGLLLWLAATQPGMRYLFGFVFVTALFGAGVGLYQVFSVGLRRLVAAAHVQPKDRLIDDRRRWRRVWAAVGTAIVIVWLNVPLRVAFWISRPALERLAREAAAAPAPVPPLLSDRPAGLFTVRAITTARYGRAIMFRVTDGGDGFAYSPGGAGELVYNEGTHGHLTGPWYWFAED